MSDSLKHVHIFADLIRLNACINALNKFEIFTSQFTIVSKHFDGIFSFLPAKPGP